jgi:hypothetical protein
MRKKIIYPVALQYNYMHYLDVRKKRSRNEFEEDIDRELE